MPKVLKLNSLLTKQNEILTNALAKTQEYISSFETFAYKIADLLGVHVPQIQA
jgi:hypothetical protein